MTVDTNAGLRDEGAQGMIVPVIGPKPLPSKPGSELEDEGEEGRDTADIDEDRGAVASFFDLFGLT